jgi:hypothetical protein
MLRAVSPVPVRALPRPAIARSLLLLVLFAGCGKQSPTPAAPPREPLLARAIAAAGGREALAGVTGVSLRSTVVERERSLEVELRIALPDRYRHDIETGTGVLTHATDGKTAWAALDGTPLTLEKADLRRLEEQLALMRLSLLLPLETDPGLAWTELPADGRAEWIEVSVSGSSSGPFRLGFAPGTGLLSFAEWRTSLPGHRTAQSVTVEFGDFRPVDRVMVPFHARYFVGSEEVASDRTLSVDLRPVFEPGVFAPPDPAREPTIVARRIGACTALVIEPVSTSTRDAERVLAAYLRELDLVRNGPTFIDREGEEPQRVGIPVTAPGPGTSTGTGGPHLRKLPARTVLSLTLARPSADSMRAAIARLEAEARARETEPDGTVRQVLWADDAVQIHLLLKDP